MLHQARHPLVFPRRVVCRRHRSGGMKCHHVNGGLTESHIWLPNMPHSRMPPTPPLRPSHPWPGVARGLGPRVKGRVLPDSPKSAPLTGGRFRRPARTHEGTPSGAHFSGRCRVWRPAGGPGRRRGASRVYVGLPCVTGYGSAGPIRVRGRRRARHTSPDGPPRGTRRRCHPPDVSLVWEDIRHPATMRHIGEHKWEPR